MFLLLLEYFEKHVLHDFKIKNNDTLSTFLLACLIGQRPPNACLICNQLMLVITVDFYHSHHTSDAHISINKNVNLFIKSLTDLNSPHSPNHNFEIYNRFPNIPFKFFVPYLAPQNGFSGCATVTDQYIIIEVLHGIN